VEDRQDELIDDLLDRATEALRRAPTPQGPPPKAVARVLQEIPKLDVLRPTIPERLRKMKRIARIAAAASVLAFIGILITWLTIGGGSTNIAFAEVAKALDGLRSATYDISLETKGENGQTAATGTGKGFFLAPSYQRMEISVKLDKTEQMKRVTAAKTPGAKAAAEAVMNMPLMKQITIIDGQSATAIMLTPEMKMAVEMDMKKMRDEKKKLSKTAEDAPLDQFETVRRLVREGSAGTGEQTEKLGVKKIDGREAVGFRTRASVMTMTLWADPGTARPIRIEVGMETGAGVHMVMDNFHYDLDLDPSLFSLKPPPDYSSQTLTMTMPVEEDLPRTLRTIAEHNKGMFPAKLGMNEEVMKALMPASNPKSDAPMEAAMNAAMKKVAAKYGGKEKLRAKYGKDKKLPPEIMAELTAEVKKATLDQTRKLAQNDMKANMARQQKQMQGVAFYLMLKPENDPHYVGGGVKLGTPNRPILWYKPTGAENYRVVCADLSVKEMSADEVKKLPAAGAK
jgi:outer membrane lipoprotein-sorting protein